MLARFGVIICSVVLLALGTGVVLFIGPTGFGTAGEFDELMGQAVDRGTQVDAARSRRSAAEAGVKKAWSRFLPSVNAYGEYGYNRNNALGRLDTLNRNHHDNSRYGVSATLPIFRGGANYYGLKEAKASAVAEQHSFHEAKQILLLDTARAILGVIRDREIVGLQRQNQTIVSSIVRSTEMRFRGGEATRTDIAIATDQLTATQSVYAQAIDNLRSNETEFQRIIGRKPGRLSLPRGIAQRLPKSLEDAVALAEQQNPQLLAAIFRSEAADHSLSASYSKFLPSVDLNMDYSEDRYHNEPLGDESDFSVKLNFTIPLFQPDALPASEESRHFSDQRRFEARDARLTAKAMATIAWRSYHTARKRYNLALSRIRAAREAATGMRRELDAGQRNILDVLDTQERLVQAKVQAANAKYERYMAAHLLLSAIGQLDASSHLVSDFKGYVHAAETKRLRAKPPRGDTGWQKASLSQPLKSQDVAVRRGGLGEKDVKLAGPLPVNIGAKWVNPDEQKRSATGGEWATRVTPSDRPVIKPVAQPAPLPVLKPRRVVAVKAALPVLKPETADKAKFIGEKIVGKKAAETKVPETKVPAPKVIVKQAAATPAVITKGVQIAPVKVERAKVEAVKIEPVKTQAAKAPVTITPVVRPMPASIVPPVRKVVVRRPVAKAVKVKDAAESDVRPAGKVEVKSDAKAASKSQPKSQPKSQSKSQSKSPSKSQSKSVAKPESKPDAKVPQVVPVKEPLPAMREGIYSRFQQRADPVVTGSVTPVAKLDGRQDRANNDDVAVGPIGQPGIAGFRAFAIHKIPLPERKSGRRVMALGGKVPDARKAVGEKGAKKGVVEYPDTMNNRFSMWWNRQVDKVVGPSGGPKPVLVPLDDYRQKYKKAK